MNDQFDSPRERDYPFESSRRQSFLSRGELAKATAHSVTRTLLCLAAPGQFAAQARAGDLYVDANAVEELSGQCVLLVFSDPHCGPWNHLARK